jgi:alpha-L-fucosidase
MNVRDAIHLLVDIVAKGGNLLLNIAPGPEGQWHEEAYELLAGIGEWMKLNGHAIYETRAIPPYKEGNICLTAKKDGAVYAIYLAGEHESSLPASISMNSIRPKPGAEIRLSGTRLKWKSTASGFTAEIPVKLRNNPPGKYAWVLEIAGIE